MLETKTGITELVLRDGHQSLLATRMRLDDMLPIAEKLDQIGYWSIESWGGATFDACIRYLGEDPWERIRKIKEVMPNTPQQMLFRGQNILGYRHYADDVVEKFVERAAFNGIDVFRVFDAMNDPRNFATAIKAVINNDRHAQAAISYTTSPVHTLESWLKLAQQLQDMGAHSICIKDMAGLLKPYDAYQLISRLKADLKIPIHLHTHATTGLSTATILKSVEAGVDNIDTSISSMSMTYGHSATESIVAMLQNEATTTGLDLAKLTEIARYFREVRKKYAQFEGSLKGIDPRILIAQVPGGMLTNMEKQLRDQGAIAQFDQVLEEIPQVRADLGYIPLVTPTSQIVGTQAVLNVINGERYKIVTNETKGILKGEYGATPATVNQQLQTTILAGAPIVTCRPADKLEPEITRLTEQLKTISSEKKFKLSENIIDDILTYALFNKTALNFFSNRHNPDAFEALPSVSDDSTHANKQATTQAKSSTYTVTVAGTSYIVQVDEEGDVTHINPDMDSTDPDKETIDAPLSGKIFKIMVSRGEKFNKGDILIILEAMKMETEIRASKAGTIIELNIAEGDNINLGDPLLTIELN